MMEIYIGIASFLAGMTLVVAYYKMFVISDRDYKNIEAIIRHCDGVDTEMNHKAFRGSGKLQSLIRGIKESMARTEDTQTMAIGSVVLVLGKISTGDFSERVMLNTKAPLFKAVVDEINATASGLEMIMDNINTMVERFQDSGVESSSGCERKEGKLTLEDFIISKMKCLIEAMEKKIEAENAIKNDVRNGIRLINSSSINIQNIESNIGEINEYISNIENIALSTNILALNASVEASTAAEHGKGFMVVASEVRELAAKSSLIAKNIKEMTKNASGTAKLSREDSNNIRDTFAEILKKIEN